MALTQDRIDTPDAFAEPMAWTALAACSGKSELFFPPFAERPQTRLKREAKAKAICAGCPVMLACRAYGREHHEYGIWGGENEEERVRAGYSLHAPIGTRHLQRERRAQAS